MMMKILWAKNFDQERMKSQRAQEARSPRLAESKDRATVGVSIPPAHVHCSPSGLPRDDQAPVLPSHGSPSAQVESDFGHECIAPWQWIQTATGWQQWGQFCRGGGGEHSELLAGLQALLTKVKTAPATPAKAKGKGKHDGGGHPPASSPSTGGASKKGKGQGSAITNDGELLKALEALVKKAQKEPETLLDCLQELVKMAVVGYGEGRAARRIRAKQAKETSGDFGMPPSSADLWQQRSRKARLGRSLRRSGPRTTTRSNGG